MRKRTFKRREANQNQEKRFLLVSEGEVTEFEYLEAVKRSRRIRSAQIAFVPPGPTSPVEIVLKAKELRDRSKRDDPFDGVWCIFDVEAKVTQNARPRLSEAIDIARQNNLSIALSNPCFELWILLHIQDCQSWIGSEQAQEKCSYLELVARKHIRNTDELLGHYATARQRAVNLELKHNRDLRSRPEDRNPSTTVFELVDAIYTAFPPRTSG